LHRSYYSADEVREIELDSGDTILPEFGTQVPDIKGGHYITPVLLQGFLLPEREVYL